MVAILQAHHLPWGGGRKQSPSESPRAVIPILAPCPKFSTPAVSSCPLSHHAPQETAHWLLLNNLIIVSVPCGNVTSWAEDHVHSLTLPWSPTHIRGIVTTIDYLTKASGPSASS